MREALCSLCPQLANMPMHLRLVSYNSVTQNIANTNLETVWSHQTHQTPGAKIDGAPAIVSVVFHILHP
jgi:hypothetical protein